MVQTPTALVPRLLDAAADAIRANADLLGELDRAIGDGDHGVNMQRGFAAISSQRADLGALALGGALEAMGKILVMNVGGASGPLYGSLLMAMGRAAAREDGTVGSMIDEGVAAVKKRGKSDRGAKTMLDVLMPVQLAWAAAQGEGLGFEETLARLRRAAQEGLEATRPMQATRGRASYLRERSIGHLDPGACSSCLLVDAVCGVLLDSART
jgi:phosphoenolpyruvate---glycerone phosphotransferase subunit DhaL